MRFNRTVNLRFFAYLLLAAVAMATGVHFLHAFQVSRNARALLDQANVAKEEDSREDELRYLSQYLGYAPDDNDARERYGILLDETPGAAPATRLKAFLVLEEVVRRDPGRHELRRRVVR